MQPAGRGPGGRRGTAAPASSTCSSAIRCRGSARRLNARCHSPARLATPRRASGCCARNAVFERFFAREAPRLAARVPRDVRALPARRAAARVRPRSLRHRRPARLGRVRAPGDRRQAGAPGARPLACFRRRGSRRWSGPTTWSWASVRPRATRRSRAALDARRGRGAMTFALPGASGVLRGRGRHRRPVHPSGAGRDPVPHALGDRARLLRASRAGPRGRAGGISLSVPRPREAGVDRPRVPRWPRRS